MSLSSEFFLPYDIWSIDISPNSSSSNRILSWGIFWRGILFFLKGMFLNKMVILEQKVQKLGDIVSFLSIMQNHLWGWVGSQDQWMCTVFSVSLCVSLYVVIKMFYKYKCVYIWIMFNLYHCYKWYSFPYHRSKSFYEKRRNEGKEGGREKGLGHPEENWTVSITKANGPNFRTDMFGTALPSHSNWANSKLVFK